MNTGWKAFFFVVGYILAGATFSGWAYHNTCVEYSERFDRTIREDRSAPCAMMAGVFWPLVLPASIAAGYFKP